jgi:hypothetical protein
MLGRWKRQRQEDDEVGGRAADTGRGDPGDETGEGEAGEAIADPDYARLVARSEEALRTKTAGHSAAWGLDRAASWAVDQQAGTLVFTHEDGTVATAAVQIVGSLDTRLGTWLWGWDHPSVRPPLRAHAERVRAHGEEHGIAELTTLELPADEARAWRFAALACELNDAQGAYRGPAGDVLTFMTFGTVELSRDPSALPPGAAGAPQAGEAGRPASGPGGPGAAEAAEVAEVEAWVKGWLAEVHAAEARYHAMKDEAEGAADGTWDAERFDRLEETIAEMERTYERYWRREDDYWRPGGVGPGDEHDVERMSDWSTRRVEDDLWRVSYRIHISPKIVLDEAFDVRRYPDGLRIVDRHL